MPDKSNMAYPHLLAAQTNSWRQLQRNRNALSVNGIQDKEQKLKRALGTSAWELACKFGSRSTIHGLDRLFGQKSGKYERLIWLLTLATALLGAIYVSLIVAERFRAGKFQTVVASTRYPVYRIAFPVVTICNLNRLNWDRLAAAKERFLPEERDPAKLQLFEQIVAAYDDIRFGNFDKFSTLEGAPLQQLNHVNFSLVVEFMTWNCEEFLTQCVWRHRSYNCCEIFSLRRGESGLCWAFNTLETEEGILKQKQDPFWPWHNGAAGPRSGLNVHLLINSEKHLPQRKNEKGISVMLTEPKSWHKDHSIIAENTQTMVEIEPVIYYYDNDTRSVSSAQRECVFNDEQHDHNFKTLHGYVYMIENCLSECHQEYLMRYCNCTVDLLYPPGLYPSCKAVDLPCLAKNNVYFRHTSKPGEEEFVRYDHQGMECKCFRNCYSLNFIPNKRPSYLPRENLSNQSFVELDVHFRFVDMMVYRTSLVFGWMDLMVSFGGIASLFLGCSLLSIVEVSYFLLVELPRFAIEESMKRKNKGIRNVTPLGKTNRVVASNASSDYLIQGKSSPAHWQSFLIPNTTKAYYLMK